MTIGQFIKEHRLKKGLTQEELALKTETSTRTIQRIENDEVDARAYTLQNIAAALDIDFEFLNEVGKTTTVDEADGDAGIWLPLLHISGIFTLLIPPLLIWLFKKDEVKNIRSHAVSVINFQLTIALYMMI